MSACKDMQTEAQTNLSAHISHFIKNTLVYEHNINKNGLHMLDDGLNQHGSTYYVFWKEGLRKDNMNIGGLF